MEAKRRLTNTAKLAEQCRPLIQDLLENVLLARVIDSCLDGYMKIHTKEDFKKFLEEMAEIVSIAERNQIKMPEKLKECDKKVRVLMVNYYRCLASAFKLSYESIKEQYHLKYEV